MATINLSVAKNGYAAWMNVSETIPADYITGNYTLVNVDLILQNGSIRTNTNGWTFEIQVNGSSAKLLTNQNLNSTVVSYHESYTVVSVSGVRVPHNADGTKTVYIHGRLEKDYYGNYDPGYVGGGGNVTLTTIPRASSVSVSSDPTLGGNAVTISCSRASTNFTHTLRVINPDNTSANVETFTGVGASKSWTPPLESKYTSLIPGESRQFTISCETFNGSTSLGSKTCTTTIHVPDQSNTKPTMNGGEYSYEDANTIAKAWGVLVQSKSRLTFSVQPVCKANSSAGSAQIYIDNSTYSGNASDGVASVAMTKVLQNSGSIPVRCNVIDSRGFKAYDSTNPSDWLLLDTLSVIKYTSPEFVMQPVVSRCRIENSSPVLDDLGEYIAMSFKGRVSAISSNSSHKNSSALLTIKWKQKAASSYNNNDKVTISGTYNSESDDYIFEKSNWILAKSGSNINIGQSTEYDLLFELTDAFNTSSNPISVSRQIGVGGDLLNFNVNGHALAIGQLSTASQNEEKLEVAYPTTFKSLPKIGDTTLANALKSAFLDMFYPVGSYYETSNTNFNPNTAWGGTWVEDSQGRMTLASGTPVQNTITNHGSLTQEQITSWVWNTGELAGEYNHQLSIAETPAHTHGNKSLTGSATNVMWDDGRSGGIAASGIVSVGGWTRNRSWNGTNGDASRALNINASHEHNSVGGNGRHNNVPPIVVVKRWHRTA